jgi:hypothetical protein
MTGNTRDDLDSAAYEVADEYRDGKLPQTSGDWTKIRASLLHELERRCPGFSAVEYGQALDEGFKWSR